MHRALTQHGTHDDDELNSYVPKTEATGARQYHPPRLPPEGYLPVYQYQSTSLP